MSIKSTATSYGRLVRSRALARNTTAAGDLKSNYFSSTTLSNVAAKAYKMLQQYMFLVYSGALGGGFSLAVGTADERLTSCNPRQKEGKAQATLAHSPPSFHCSAPHHRNPQSSPVTVPRQTDHGAGQEHGAGTPTAAFASRTLLRCSLGHQRSTCMRRARAATSMQPAHCPEPPPMHAF